MTNDTWHEEHLLRPLLPQDLTYMIWNTRAVFVPVLLKLVGVWEVKEQKKKKKTYKLTHFSPLYLYSKLFDVFLLWITLKSVV